jgi:organic radical activating enzyme
MLIEREESWGVLQYDTVNHRFSYRHRNGKEAFPYASTPIVLNCDLTLKCNMCCSHCVAKDFSGIDGRDLAVSPGLIETINKSPFLLVVVTGGEPLLPEYQANLIKLLKGIKGKGLVIDTNGTIIPNEPLLRAILESHALVRVSWDSVRPRDEIYFRHMKPDTPKNKTSNLACFHQKLDTIQWLKDKSIPVAIQSVIHKKNLTSISAMIPKLLDLNIRQWYIQRFIPSYKADDEQQFGVGIGVHTHTLSTIAKDCASKGLECIAKRDRRHNSVFLLIGDGDLYTQGEKPHEKIFLGKLNRNTKYFDYVSSSDHCERYYA